MGCLTQARSCIHDETKQHHRCRREQRAWSDHCPSGQSREAATAYSLWSDRRRPKLTKIADTPAPATNEAKAPNPASASLTSPSANCRPSTIQCPACVRYIASLSKSLRHWLRRPRTSGCRRDVDRLFLSGSDQSTRGDKVPPRGSPFAVPAATIGCSFAYCPKGVPLPDFGAAQRGEDDDAVFLQPRKDT
jgi:hypothetical protein